VDQYHLTIFNENPLKKDIKYVFWLPTTTPQYSQTCLQLDLLYLLTVSCKYSYFLGSLAVLWQRQFLGGGKIYMSQVGQITTDTNSVAASMPYEPHYKTMSRYFRYVWSRRLTKKLIYARWPPRSHKATKPQSHKATKPLQFSSNVPTAHRPHRESPHAGAASSFVFRWHCGYDSDLLALYSPHGAQRGRSHCSVVLIDLSWSAYQQPWAQHWYGWSKFNSLWGVLWANTPNTSYLITCVSLELLQRRACCWRYTALLSGSDVLRIPFGQDSASQMLLTRKPFERADPHTAVASGPSSNVFNRPITLLDNFLSPVGFFLCIKLKDGPKWWKMVYSYLSTEAQDALSIFRLRWSSIASPGVRVGLISLLRQLRISQSHTTFSCLLRLRFIRRECTLGLLSAPRPCAPQSEARYSSPNFLQTTE
jgi:hypothetical protein